MAVGGAINFLSDMGKKPSIQIHNRHSMHLTHFVLVNISIMNLHWTELLNFCWSIGLFASQSAHATIELVRYLCRSNTHSETTICFNMYMSCLFYGYAKNDRRFLEAFETLKSKTVEGKIVVERVVPKLAKLSFCRKGFPSELATRRIF